jgi:hypothetical protein
MMDFDLCCRRGCFFLEMKRIRFVLTHSNTVYAFEDDTLTSLKHEFIDFVHFGDVVRCIRTICVD